MISGRTLLQFTFFLVNFKYLQTGAFFKLTRLSVDETAHIKLEITALSCVFDIVSQKEDKAL